MTPFSKSEMMIEFSTAVTDSVDQTGVKSREFAERIKELTRCEASVTICLDGNLGAGKTTFTTGFCSGWGIAPEEISSPTFSLQNIYTAELDGQPITINHFDFYRLNDEDELFEIGFEETVQQPGIHIVEWSNRFPQCLPEQRIELFLTAFGENRRKIICRASSEHYRKYLV